VSGLGFTVLSSFKNHNGFDGAIVGNPHAPYHLEFTTHHVEEKDLSDEAILGGLEAATHREELRQKEREKEAKAPSQDHLLVFYIPSKQEWEARVEKMEAAGWKSVKSFNEWWDRTGKTYEDPEGWRIVLQWGMWHR
jgi:hypothetical protein